MDLNEQTLEHAIVVPSDAVKGNANLIALAIGGTLLLVGTGIGWFLGGRRGMKKGEIKGQEEAKVSMKEGMDAMADLVKAAKPDPVA